MARETGIALTVDARKAERGVRRFGRALDRAQDKARQTVTRMRRGFAGLNSIFTNLGRSIKGTLIAGLTSLVALVSGAALFRGLVRINKEFETMRAALITLTGSLENANIEFAALQEFAKTTPFTLDQSVNAFIKLQDLGIRPTEELLTSLGNTAAAKAKPLMQLIEAVADASVGEFERLKEFSIKANQEGEKVIFTFKRQKFEVEKSAEEIVDFLKSIGETNFAGAMEEQMKRLPGALSNLEDSFTKLGAAVGEGGFTEGVNNLSNALAGLNATLIETKLPQLIGKTSGALLELSANTIEGIKALISLRSIIELLGRGDSPLKLGLSNEGVLANVLEAQLRIFKESGILGGKTEIGSTIPEIEGGAEKVDKAMQKAIESIQDFQRETRASTQALERQIGFIQDQNVAFNEQSDQYQRLLAQLEAEQRLRDAGIPLVEFQGKKLKDLTNIIFENMKAEQQLNNMLQEIDDTRAKNREIDRTIDGLVFERDSLIRLNEARKQGTEAYKDARTAVNALSIARELGIRIGGQEHQVIEDLIKRIDELAEAERNPIHRTWTEGAVDALERYRESVKDVGGDIELFFTNSLNRLEDQFTEFFTTGKFEFQNFADAILRDLNRIFVRQAITAPLAGAIQGSVEDGFLGNLFGSRQMAEGGIVTRPTLATIGERGRPEAVIPLKNGAVPVVMQGGQGMGTTQIVVNINESSGGRTLASSRQQASEVGAQIAREMRKMNN